MKTRFLILLVVASIAFFSLLQNAEGLIMGHPLEFWDSADVLLDGVVISTSYIESDELIQHDVRVEQYFKNPKPQQMITVYGPTAYNEDWFYPKFFEEGQRALFYLKKVDDKFIILEHSLEATEQCDPRGMIGLSSLPGEDFVRGGLTLFFDPYQTCNGYLTPAGLIRASLSPLKQIHTGIMFGDIGCKKDLQLMFRHNSHPVCVKQSSISRLLDYGGSLVEQGELQLRIPLPTVEIVEFPKEIDNETPLSFGIEVLDIKENHNRPTITITNENKEKVWSAQWSVPSHLHMASSIVYDVQYYKEDFPEKIILESGNYMVSVFLDNQKVSKKLSVTPKFDDLSQQSNTQLGNLPKIESFAVNIFSTCGQDNDCTIEYLQKISRETNRQSVLNTINDLMTVYVDADFYCHPSAHHIGEFLYGFVDRDLAVAAKYVDSRCASGLLHGLVENTIEIENLLYGTPVDKVDYVAPCETIGEKLGAHAKVQCIHGIGHSIIKIYDYDTIEAVKECHTYEKTSERFMCRGGLFMQNMKKYTDDKGGDFDDSDIYYPCNKLDDSDADLCYRYKSQYFLINNNYNATDTFRLCDGIGDPDFVGWCYKGTGSHLAKEYFYDIDSTVALCNLGDEKYRKLCVKGAIESIMLYVSAEYGPPYCEKIDPVLKNDCIKRMNEIRGTIF